MSEAVPLFVLHAVGFAGFLWLGLYALTRGDRGPVATLTGATALVTACFFVSGALNSLQTDHRTAALLQRLTWWDNILPIALWLHLSLRLNPRAEIARWRRPALLGAYGLAVALSVVGMATNLVRDYTGSSILGPVTAGPLYPLYVAFLLGGTGVAVVNMVGLRRAVRSADAGDAEHEGATSGDDATTGAPLALGGTEIRLLLLGGICFLLGAGYLAVNNLIQLTRYEFPAYTLLLAGLGAVGAAIVVQGALLLGKDVRRDALYSLTGLAGLLILYLLADGLLVGITGLQHGIFALVLTALITCGHVLYDVLRAWLDQVFFTPSVRAERAAARAYAEALAVPPIGPHPDLATVKAFDDAVRRALTHLSDPTKLATAPLLTLRIVERAIAEQGLEDNRLNRAAALREILINLLDGLRPTDGSRVTHPSWRYYNCLYYPYVRGIGRRQAPTVLRQLQERRRREGTPRGNLELCIEWMLQVDQDTWYKWQRRGSDTLSAAVREREAALGGPVPGNPRPFLPRQPARTVPYSKLPPLLWPKAPCRSWHTVNGSILPGRGSRFTLTLAVANRTGPAQRR